MKGPEEEEDDEEPVEEEEPELYDAEEDDENARWVDEQLRGKGSKHKTDAMLSCPSCFTLLCADCQKHDEYDNQFRAMFVTPSCRVDRTQLLRFPSTTADATTAPSPLDDFHPVLCAICSAEVGVFCIADEVYHFFDVCPST